MQEKGPTFRVGPFFFPPTSADAAPCAFPPIYHNSKFAESEYLKKRTSERGSFPKRKWQWCPLFRGARARRYLAAWPYCSGGLELCAKIAVQCVVHSPLKIVRGVCFRPRADFNSVITCESWNAYPVTNGIQHLVPHTACELLAPCARAFRGGVARKIPPRNSLA
jgi:hypothetical protein